MPYFLLTPVLSAALLGLLHLPAPAHQAAAGASAHKPAASAPASPAEQTAWGIAATPTQVQRTITIDMGDNMRFSPDLIEVKQGETLKLVVRNQGRKLHELVLGTPAELDKHAELMKRHPGMEHDEPWMSHVRAGQQGEMLWTFNRAGEFAFACLVGSHYQRGMKGRIIVRPTTP